MSAERFIADRISGTGNSKGSISKPIVKIGIIGITLGVAVMLLTISIVLGFKNEITSRITGLTTHIAIGNINVNPGNEQEPISISDDSISYLKNLPWVLHIQKTAFKNGLLKTETENEGVLLKGVGEDYDFSFLNKHLVEGRLPDLKGEEASKDILISKVLAEKMNIKLNDKVLIHFISQHTIYDSLVGGSYIKSEQRSRKLKVCGIFKTDFVDFDEKLSVVDLRQVQNINFWQKNQVGNYEIGLKSFDRLEESQEQIREFLGYSYSVSSVKEIYQNIFIWLDKLDINGVIIIVLMILVATINMITALLILILERTNMVGLVKALGMSNANVRKIFIHISLKLIGRGLLWGNIIGIGLCLLQYYFHIAKLDSETYYVDHVAVQINWWYFLLLNVGTFLVCVLMLLLPTLVITKLTPIKTLKFD
ncbi:MAG: ABC transporter permease [Bacteroidia bacterium]|nr:ABC transporter permease [Bacteroidia bacterium]